ncbi:Transcriptional regulator, LysR family [hydrothermal vent metagenome]|uniref:Transcriptional regulator, LysR family n=1 Tax=hydrothermal vent metagenome TaxID=652676 RepID=A0A3B0YK11_9ZZZZ
MDIASLKAFLAVADTGSFSLAAEHLFLTQPAISKRIATLENELEERLFDRIGRTVSLTEAGRALQPRARNILVEVDDSVRAISNLSGEVHGTLRFATSHHIGLHRLPPALKAFTQQYPDVQLDIRFMDSEAACQAVEHGELELAIVTLPPEPSPNLSLDPVWSDPLGIVVSREHPLAGKRRISLSALLAHPAILPATGTYTRQIAEQAFNKAGATLDVALSTNYLETIHMLVSVGIGWSLLPLTMLDGQVQHLKVQELQLKRTLGVVAHRERTLSNAACALQKLLHKA